MAGIGVATEMFIPDKYARTVKLRVCLRKDQWVMEDGKPLPELREGTWAELTFSAESITDEQVQRTLTTERQVAFLPATTVLWARIREESLPSTLSKFRESRRMWAGEPGHFIRFVLREDLKITLRGSKNAFLDDCACDIPALDKIADSVNQAYTLISTAFEPTRRSHAGNVFQKVFLEHEKFLRSLDVLRVQIEANPPPEDDSGS
jgi:hypothetical protein